MYLSFCKYLFKNEGAGVEKRGLTWDSFFFFNFIFSLQKQHKTGKNVGKDVSQVSP